MKRGDVYLADLDPVKGSEQAGRRPVLIFQDDPLISVPRSSGSFCGRWEFVSRWRRLRNSASRQITMDLVA
jgi:hypothetical protein